MPESGGVAAAETLVAKVMAATKETMDLWNSIVKKCSVKVGSSLLGVFSGIVLRNLEGHELPFYKFSSMSGWENENDGDECTLHRTEPFQTK